MKRTRPQSSGLRELLLADYRRSLERWQLPGRIYPKEEAFAAGEPVVVSAADMLRALLHAGLPHGDYCYGGRHWSKVFVLDESDRLVEVR